jgi:hypothetical protein
MSKQVTRRNFLQRGTTGSLAVLTASSRFSALSVSSIWAEVEQAVAPSTVLTDVQRKLLRFAADEIIPAADGMPAATEAGAAEYIEVLLGKLPDLQKQMQSALARIDQIGRSRFKRSFDQLTSAQRVRTLQAFEKESSRAVAGQSLYGAVGDLFAALRDLVYEGYYTSPKVWPGLGYEFHPTSKRGPAMEQFNEAILANARKRPKNYREVK